MGIRHLTAAMYYLDGNNPLTPTEKLLLVVLADRMNDDHAGWCWPSYGNVSQIVGINRRNTMIGIQRLEDKGLLEVDRETGSHRPNRYRLSPPLLVSPATPPSVASDTPTSVASDTQTVSNQKEPARGRVIPIISAASHPSSRSVADVLAEQDDYQ